MNTSPYKDPHKMTVKKFILSINAATVKHVNKTIFDDFNFQIQKGEQWAIIGRSGSGKTALLHTLLGHFNVVKGTIKFPVITAFKEDHNIVDPLFTNSDLIAFVQQQAHFKNKQNLNNFFYQQRYHAQFSEEADTVETYLKERKEKMITERKRKPIKFSFTWILKHLQLEPLLSKTLIQLSNGETRRLMIADALLQQPLILLMDNPFIGLDHASRLVLEQILQQIIKTKTSVIMATTPREIPECITHIAELDGESKKVKAAGPKTTFKTSLATFSVKSKWQPDPDLLSKIDGLKPVQDHHFDKAIEMRDIKVVSQRKTILNKINWTVNIGEKWALLGPNGAGKSTLLSLINGDHPQAYANKIELFDQQRGSGESIWELKHRMGFVSPEMHQYFKGNHLITDVILSGFNDTMGIRKKSPSKQEKQLVQDWLELLTLSSLSNRRFRDIPAGEQRLILLIRAMIKNPPLLILDEPCQGLDEEQRNHFKRIVDMLWDRADKTLLYVSHYKEDIPSCVHHILALKEGEIQQ